MPSARMAQRLSFRSIFHNQIQYVGADQHDIDTNKAKNDIRMTFPDGIIEG